MEKITIKNLVDFNRKTDIGRQNLINNLKTPKVKTNPDEGGGNYWISALSGISKTFVAHTDNMLADKIDELIDKIETHEAKITKDMYQRNINILREFEEFDFSVLRPQSELRYKKKQKDKSIIPLKSLPLYTTPQHVFTFKENEEEKIGAVWFIARLGGLRKEELAMAADILYRYLNINYSAKHKISNDFCLAVDVNSINVISYTQVSNEEIKSPLLKIVSEIKKLI